MAGLSFYSLSNCILHVLLVHYCQSRLIGPNQPITATAGEDITLPCHLVPGENVAAMTLEWTRPDLDPRFVFLWRAGQDLINMKNPSYIGRSSLFTDELKHGNISLKLCKVKPADEGRYRCHIPEKNEEAFIDLVVASSAVSSPVISLEGIDRDKTGVVLECKSEGWHPKPELLWLDAEGNLLSAGPTETLRGPDDLYTVSSRVTVEKRHSNNITCRVQQKQISKSRETHRHVPDEFFELTSCSAAPIVIGLAVSLAVSIILILIGVFFIWRQNKTNVRRAHCDARKEQETANRPESDKTERDQEQDKLMLQDIVACEKNQHAVEKLKEADEKLKAAHRQLEKKDAEISNMKKEPDTSKPPPEKSQTSFEEQNKSDSANHSSKTGDITVVEVEKNGSYIFLKNTSSENKLLSGWKLKLQINNRESATYEFKENFILKAGKTLLLRQDAVNKPNETDADLLWMNMVIWNIGDDVKIDLISNTGEEQMLFKNKIM
ncbi:butyrophilin subfamily 3 member A2-like isoform X2 [Maylandia zebra]|uniref:butyrophilin subfamily 3 member A2-like isoform X2 n=1 Tax=Maylandia zebra TaxID=106582 RepID=UPI00403CC1E3